MTSGRQQTHYDVVIVGAGHNGLVAATLLARSGRSVLVLERRERVGGAAVSESPWPGIGVGLSRYAYLVSLFPAELMRALGLDVELRRRAIASYTPVGGRGLLDRGGGHDRSRGRDAGRGFDAMVARMAARLFPTLLEPLRSRAELQRLIDDPDGWEALFEQPLSAVLEDRFESDAVRGVALTDAVIGTFAPAGDPLLRQNRCFLYHAIGNGTGHWDVPVGGMGALTDRLAELAAGAGAELRTRAEVSSVATDGRAAELECADGRTVQAADVLANVAPAVLARLLGEPKAEADPAPAPEGSQLKVNMLLRRLPRLRDRGVSVSDAFTGTFHVNEGYEQLQRAFEEAAAGRIPALPPCELYCHSLSDPGILSQELRAAGAHTLTLFGLHMPARLFTGPDAADAKRRAVEATLRSVDSVLAEPLEDCLCRQPDGQPCLEALTPPELESELAMPGGHIFHRDLAWPFAETEPEVGSWGVETAHPNLWICGAGARRGGGVSGIPGHNAARAVLAARSA